MPRGFEQLPERFPNVRAAAAGEVSDPGTRTRGFGRSCYAEGGATMIFTLGHGTRPLKEFVALLQEHGVQRIVDVRTIPRPQYNPQFNREWLPAALERAGVAYSHAPELGSLRHARKDSINTAWRNASFRGFSDYMETEAFEAGLEKLIALAGSERVAILCAEALPWRCHRSLIADALVARGIEVQHIVGCGPVRPHALTLFARVEGGRVSYPESAGESPAPTVPQ